MKPKTKIKSKRVGIPKRRDKEKSRKKLLLAQGRSGRLGVVEKGKACWKPVATDRAEGHPNRFYIVYS